MGALCVPDLEERGREWPTLGPGICDFLEARSIFGPGSLKGTQYKLDAEKRAAICRAYEVYPRDYPNVSLRGRRRFKRVGLSWRKGLAKTEWAAQIAFAELHPEAEVRFDGWRETTKGVWVPVGRPVRDPYIPMVAYTEDQAEELAYGCLMVLVGEGPDADLFDIALERIIRIGENGRPDGKAVALSGSPNANDGARTTFQHF